MICFVKIAAGLVCETSLKAGAHRLFTDRWAPASEKSTVWQKERDSLKPCRFLTLVSFYMKRKRKKRFWGIFLSLKEFFFPILHKKFISNGYNVRKHSEKFADGACDMGEERKEEEKVLENEREREEENLQEESSYKFLKETIKAKPIDKQKLAKSLGKLIGAGAIFGLAAACVFAVLAPGMTKKAMDRQRGSKVQFSSQEETQEEEQEEEIQEEDQGEVQESAAAVQELTPEDYKKLYSDIFSKAEEAEKAMVTVIGSQNDQDWFQTPYETQLSGLLVAQSENGQEYYVLTEYRIVENVDRIQVVFHDGTMTDARFQKADSNTGFAILKIPMSEVSAETKAAISIAPLGDSYNVKQGEPVLAIGSPMGYSDSVGYGIVTSTTNKVSKVDAEYGLITTDITGSSQGSGVIMNLDGEIIGIIAQSFAKEDTKNLITGISISQCKELIQTLSGNQEIIYMGITGENITSEISEKKGIPVGVFVEQVEVDSPAMQVGIQNGDVIVEIDGEKVETVRGYQQQLKSCKAGETIKVKAMRQGTEGYVEVSFDVTLKAK